MKSLLWAVANLGGDRTRNDERHDAIRVKVRRGSCSWRICDLDETEVAQWLTRDLLPDHVTPRRGNRGLLRGDGVVWCAVTAAVASRETREA
jgi:hypothetical protein